MKGKRIILGFIVALASLCDADAQDQNSEGGIDLTLQKAIEIALAENPTIRVADKEIELKKVADKEAWQALLPTLDAQISLSHSIKVAEMVIGDMKVKMGKDGTTTLINSLTLSLPLFAPAVYQNMRLTKEDILLAEEKARGSRLDLVNQVTKAYYGALLSADSYEVMKKNHAVAQENFDVVSKKFEVGKVSEYDKISAEVQVRSMSSAVTSAATGKQLALLRLKVLMGVTADVNFNISETLKSYENQLVLSNTLSDENELQNNSSLRQLDQNMSLLQRSQKIIRTGFMPTIGLQMQGQYVSYSNSHWNIFKYNYSPAVSLAFAVNIPIFHADNWTKLKKNKIQISQLEDTRINTQRQLSMAAESYKKNMESNIAQVHTNAEAVKQADKAVTISSKRYEVGRGTILEVNQSEIALTQAELTYVQSIYDFLTNRADLDYTLGRDYTR